MLFVLFHSLLHCIFVSNVVVACFIPIYISPTDALAERRIQIQIKGAKLYFIAFVFRKMLHFPMGACMQSQFATLLYCKIRLQRTKLKSEPRFSQPTNDIYLTLWIENEWMHIKSVSGLISFSLTLWKCYSFISLS